MVFLHNAKEHLTPIEQLADETNNRDKVSLIASRLEQEYGITVVPTEEGHYQKGSTLHRMIYLLIWNAINKNFLANEIWDPTKNIDLYVQSFTLVLTYLNRCGVQFEQTDNFELHHFQAIASQLLHVIFYDYKIDDNLLFQRSILKCSPASDTKENLSKQSSP